MGWLLPDPDPQDADFVVVGGHKNPLRDVYDFLMRAPWSTGVLVVVVLFLTVNVCFAAAYDAVGGIFGARPHVFRDFFFFSVQTLGTMGYGAMYPVSTGAHLLVTTEVLVGIFMLALVTGFTFSKFSNVRARIQFARQVVISPYNGVPTLMLRVGNERRSRVIDARIRVALTRLEKTDEGVALWRMIDLKLEREQIPNLARSWTVFHRITDQSPFFGGSPESLAQSEAELVILVTGLDETSSQTLHATARYDHKQILWGARHEDVLHELPDGRLEVDLRRFHDVVATAPTVEFPYPAAPSSASPEAAPPSET